MYNGIINVYKEKGFTSFDVVAKLRGILQQKKIGHTGTLDPDAEGVLPVCLGKATKVCELLTEKDKEYEAVLLLGKQTDTQDITGRILKESQVRVSKEEVLRVIASFVGKQEQIPPMYSALKVNGQKLCDMARKGIVIERKPRPIEIFSIEITSIELPRVTMTIRCSKGTYIRTLCHDIGNQLGCYGCMEALKRTRVDIFKVQQSKRISEIEKLVAEGKVNEEMIGVDELFLSFKKCDVGKEAQKLVDNGNRISATMLESFDDEWQSEEKVRLYDFTGRFVGIYTYCRDTNELKPMKLFI